MTDQGVDVRDEARNVATGNPIAVLPGVYELRESLGPRFDTPDCWVSLYVLVDPAGHQPPAIVDTGIPRTTETVLLPGLKALGLQPRELAVAVNTHWHGDHAGSNVPLREATGCELWIHREDAPWLEKGTEWGAEPIPPHSADRLLEAGETVQLAGRSYEVIHLPGHSSGSIGLYDRERRVLLTGDSLQGQGTSTQGIAGAQDREGYYRALAAADGLDVEHLLAAHPYRPATDSHVQPRDAVRRFLAESRRFFDHVDDEILSTLRAAGAPLSVSALADRICAARGFDRTGPLAPRILDGYVRRLESQERVRAETGATEVRWRAV